MEPDQEYIADEPSERDLGFGYEDDSGYLTGNDSDEPDSPDVVGSPDDRAVPEEIPEREPPSTDLPGAGDSRVGLGEGTGAERFAATQADDTSTSDDTEAIGTADIKTTEAVYHQWAEHPDGGRGDSGG